MNSYIIYSIIIGVTGILIFLIWFLRRKIKRKKEERKEIPEEILIDFNKAEEMLEQGKGKLTPQEILLKIYKDKNELEDQDQDDLLIETKEIPKPMKERRKINISNLFKK